MFIFLSCRDVLFCCNTDVYTVDRAPVCVHCQHTLAATSTTPQHGPLLKFTLTTRARQVESNVWALRFGSPGEGQLDVLPCNVDGMPPVFEYHPFCFVDFKEQAYICKQPAQRTAEHIPGCGSELFMVFGFMRASTEEYKWLNKALDCIIHSYDGNCAYLLIVDSES
jgi:hypothetical protein